MRRRIAKQKYLDSLEESLYQVWVNSYAEEYKELKEMWRNLETKAQGTTAIAGIFIAGAFTYISKIDSNTEQFERIFLIISTIFLVIAIWISVSALTIREAYKSPIGKNLDVSIEDARKNKNEPDFPEIVRKLSVNQLNTWRVARDSISDVCELKANRLWFAHSFLLAAVLAVALLLLFKLFNFHAG
ncbi:MAG: hypothetical protein ABWZ66_09920 [Pyrinomonadaceae bacterium]